MYRVPRTAPSLNLRRIWVIWSATRSPPELELAIDIISSWRASIDHDIFSQTPRLRWWHLFAHSPYHRLWVNGSVFGEGIKQSEEMKINPKKTKVLILVGRRMLSSMALINLYTAEAPFLLVGTPNLILIDALTVSKSWWQEYNQNQPLTLELYGIVEY